MPLLFAVVLSLVILLPVLGHDRFQWTRLLRVRLYLALGIAGVGMILYAVGMALPGDQWLARTFLKLFALGVGLISCGFLAVVVLENTREISQTSDPDQTDQSNEAPHTTPSAQGDALTKDEDNT